MANRLKKKTPPPPDPEKLTADKETQVTVTEVVKDERTAKIAGAVSLLLAIFLFVAFTSYLFTWQDDQDKVHQFGVKIFATDDLRVNNLLGVLGAYVAHNLFYKGFGFASYLFCSFFFVLGVNLLFARKVFNLLRNLKYVVVGLVVISMAFAFVAGKGNFSWGGAVGELLNEWFVKWIGRVGTGALLALAVFSYVIWRFNPVFKLPVLPRRAPAATPIIPEPEEDAVRKEWNDDDDEITEEKENAAAEIPKPNKLKGESKGVVVIMPQAEHNPMNEFDVVERDEQPEEETEPESEEEPEPEEEEAPFMEMETEEEITEEEEEPEVEEEEEEDDNGLELEIKETPEEEAEEAVAPAPAGKLNTRYDATLDLKNYKYPGIDLLEIHGSEKIVHDPAELEANKNQIIATLKNYDIAIQRIAATVGPTVTLYEIVPAPGVRISRIKNLEDDIALSLAALGIRIIAPIPGKGTIGIEVPNVRKTIVSMRTLLSSEKFQTNAFSLPIAIGKKIDNENFIVDLASMPHLLMAGATGQGKSVGLNAILVSLLYKKHPSQLKFVLVDPKKVELSLYRVIEKHFLAKLPGEDESIITDTKKVINTLNALCIEMDNRYDLLKEAGCRNIKEYNEKFTARRLNPEKGHQYLPFIVLVVDEFADLIMTAGKEVEMPIARLAQLARAVGIHLIIATQRPSVNIITGTIKANFPARIAFKVSSKIDSRTILDAGGAEQLIGKGDMLVSYNGEITRLQCAFVDTPEVEHVCEFIGDQRGYPQAFLLPEYVDEKELEGKDFDAGDRDPLFEDAARLIVQSQMGSTSLIQRRMKLGYNRAGRLMDQLEAAGIVGPNQGSKAREVLFKTDMELQDFLDSLV
ncbi:FtsK/SpoIIIE family DNA translocase [Sediminibacterium ginsengisoli]|uniref:DNA segregation ATPase FtsK/SpoIIIE, S-DNA-T family n=1 Tax=Sediminibacterium ginsengisoli TaxID=413434 RepID=A0A1T4LGZ5_9BACT|nr:DNA translocase FtsK 4TM domain-containing protein [Sediminibacterium ginsengisoli]SJZ53878.1 DNA segregation ATPase FtsK/SpoIIIE, S-DNA-T family [Sediminibacterium ginsengisoli]